MSKRFTRKVVEKVAKHAFRGAAQRRLVGAITSGALDQCVDTVRLLRGDISKREYKGRTAQNVLGTGGSLGGAYACAAIGTMILPGVGTAVGGIIGGFLGGNGARAAARAIFG